MNTANFSSDESRWQAVIERDRQADGAFFFAVRTTGVFCRPSCASRSPRQYQAAQRAGVLRDALQRDRDVTCATHDAGFGSPSRMYEAVPAELGMTPSAYKRKGAGLTVRYTTAIRRSAPC